MTRCGVAAPLLLLALRILQGVAFSGEAPKTDDTDEDEILSEINEDNDEGEQLCEAA